MRGAVTIKLGTKEYPLLPSFGVMSDFEDRYGSIMAHYDAMARLTATTAARSYLIYLAAKAAREEAGENGIPFTPEAVAERLFERGLWHESTVIIEQDLIESLLWTPEQFQAKKDDRAAQEKAQKQAMEALAALENFAESPSQTSSGNPQSSAARPRKSSGRK